MNSWNFNFMYWLVLHNGVGMLRCVKISTKFGRSIEPAPHQIGWAQHQAQHSYWSPASSPVVPISFLAFWVQREPISSRRYSGHAKQRRRRIAMRSGRQTGRASVLVTRPKAIYLPPILSFSSNFGHLNLRREKIAFFCKLKISTQKMNEVYVGTSRKHLKWETCSYLPTFDAHGRWLSRFIISCFRLFTRTAGTFSRNLQGRGLRRSHDAWLKS